MNNTAKNLVTGIYRSKDCIKNFKIRIRLEKEKLSLVAVHEEDSEDHSGKKIEEREFSWQEKVYSPFEASYYRFPGNCHSPLEEKYHEDVVHLWEHGPPTNRLFTYTDADKCTGDEEVHGKVGVFAQPSCSLEDGALKQSVGHTRRRLRRELHARRDIVDFCPTEDTLRRNHTLQNACQTFHILADLSTANITEEVDWAGRSEYILCTVRWDGTNCVLAVTPDFSPDPYVVEVDEDSRSLYCYWVTHASSNISQQEYDCERELLDKLADHHRSIRQVHTGLDFDMPHHGVLTVYIMGEIMCARDFEADQLFILFFVELPKGWSSYDPEHLTGVTHVCHTGRDDIANFGHTFQFKLNYSLDLLQLEPEMLPECPQLYLEVVSSDGWGRCSSEGYGSMRFPATPGHHMVTVPTWRPEPVGITARLRRFFLGGSPQLLNPTRCGVPCNFQGHVVSKYGLPTVTSGSVSLCLNVIHQSLSLVDKEKSSARDTALLERLSAATLVNSVNSVLLVFRRARERMLEARSALQVS